MIITERLSAQINFHCQIEIGFIINSFKEGRLWQIIFILFVTFTSGEMKKKKVPKNIYS